MMDGLKELLEKRRNRALAAVLGYKDRECDAYLPPEISLGLRRVVLEQLNEYHTLIVDILESMDNNQTVAVNGVYLGRLDAIFDGMERLVASLDA